MKLNIRHLNRSSTILSSYNYIAKPAERRGRKTTGPRFLREAMEDLPKDPRSPGCRVASTTALHSWGGTDDG